MKSLSEAAVRQYRELGYLAPMPAAFRGSANELVQNADQSGCTQNTQMASPCS